jgi:CheY-like chemotaxis protein
MTHDKGTILLIDDDASMLRVLEVALKDAGYQVISATDGIEGLELISQHQPALVISDIMMPNMDGVEFFRAIKERLEHDAIPIILITALNRKPWFRELEDEGAAFLQKPFDVEHLVGLVNVSLM